MGRPLLSAGITLDGLTLRVADCLLDSLAEHGEKRIRLLAQAFRQPGAAPHAILPGDFKFADGAPENKALDSGFRDVWRTLYPDRPGDTFGFHGDADSAGQATQRLDRILLRSPRLRATDATLIGAEPVAHGDTLLYLSDHFGVGAVLRLAAP